MNPAGIVLALVQLGKLGLEIAEAVQLGRMTPEDAVREWNRASNKIIAANAAWVAAWLPGQPASPP